MAIAERRQELIKRILRTKSYQAGEDKKTEKQSITEKLDIFLNKNNISLNIKEFLILILILSTIPILIGLFFRINFFISCLFSVMAIFLIFIVIEWRKRRENIKKENQIEQFLLDLVGNLYANPNILTAIQKTLEDTEYPLREEFEIVLNDTRKGLLLNDALKNMIKRNSSPIIEVVIVGFIAANDKGVDLIEFLKDQIEYIREKRSIENYIKILSSSPRYTSYLIMAIPIVSMIIISIINKNFIKIIFSGYGIIFLVYAVLSYTLGFLIINKIVNFAGGNKNLT